MSTNRPGDQLPPEARRLLDERNDPPLTSEQIAGIRPIFARARRRADAADRDAQAKGGPSA